MANQRNLSNVNVGTAPNTGEGDLLRDAFIKINDNFSNIYANGQFLANITESRGAPGYSWEDDRNTGFYNPEDGVIIVSLNGTDSLIMRSNGLIVWRGDKLTTETDLNAALAGITGGGTGVDGGTGGDGFSGIDLVENLPTDGNFEGRLVLNNQDGQVYIWQNGEWVLFRETLTPDAPTGIEFVNDFPTDNLWEGRTVIKDGVLYIYQNGQWNDLLDTTTPVASAITRVEVVTALPTSDNFEGRQVLYEGELYIFFNNAWVPAAELITPTASSITSVEIVTALPTADNFEGRQVLYDGQLYIYYNGAFVRASEVITPIASSVGIVEVITEAALPTTGNFEGRTVFFDDGLWIYVNGAWTNYNTYIAGSGGTDLGPNSVTGNMIVDGAISATKLAAGSVVAGKIQAGAIGAQEIAAGAITATKIATDAITAGKVAAGAINTRELAAGAITADKIGANQITAGKVAAGAINADQIAAGAISTDKLAATSITAAKIQAGAIGTDQLAARAITATKIASGTITANEIASRSITASQIQTGTLTGNEIQAGSINGDRITAGSITATQLSATAITADKIGSGTSVQTQGSFGLGVNQAVQGRPTVGYFQSTNDGRYPLVSYHSATSGGDAHGFVAAARSPGSYAATLYNLGSTSVPGTWARNAAYLAGGTTTTDVAGVFLNYLSSTRNSNQGLYGLSGNRSIAYIAKPDFAARFETRTGIYSSPQFVVEIAGESNPVSYYGCIAFARYSTSGAVQNTAVMAQQNHAFIAPALSGRNKIYSGDGFNPFTGIHEGLISPETQQVIELGDILVDDELIAKQDLINVKFKQVLSSQANQKGVIGVASQIYTLEETNEQIDLKLGRLVPTTDDFTIERDPNETDEEYADRLAEAREIEDQNRATLRSLNHVHEKGNCFVDIAAVGEGQINVCGEGGEIERGDLIVTSSIPGKGMKQSDDIVRAITVAKARESVTFASSTEVKTIACVYLCG
jgi:hypothetical protein